MATYIRNEAERIAEILDDSYNSQGYDGGYIVVAESREDLHLLCYNRCETKDIGKVAENC